MTSISDYGETGRYYQAKVDAKVPTLEFRPQYKRVISFISWIKRLKISTVSLLAVGGLPSLQ